MSDLYEEYGLEVEDKGAETPKMPDKPVKTKTIVKRKGGWLGRIIALLLGAVIGVGACAGGVYFVVSQPTKDVVNLVGGFAGLDYETNVKNKLLSEEYGDKTLLEVGMAALSAAAQKNLKGIAEMSPIVGEYLDKTVEKMNSEFGINMDSEELKATQFDQLPSYLGTTFKNTPIGSMLRATSGKDELEPILMEICYGELGVHYVIDENGDVQMINGATAATFETLGASPEKLINNVSLASVVTPEPTDTVMLAIAYGMEGTTYELATDEEGNYLYDANGHVIVNMLPLYFTKDEAGNFLDYKEDVVQGTVLGEEAGFVAFEKAPTYEGGISETFYLHEDNGDGKYYAYKTIEGEPQRAYFKKTMIGDMSQDSMSIIDNIYLKDALNVTYEEGKEDPHKILFSLAYGQENVDYYVDYENGRKIVMIGDSKPRTIGERRERNTALINEISLADIMTADSDDAVNMYLLYGRKNVHYKIAEDGSITMLTRRIAIDDTATPVAVYNEYGEPYAFKTETTAGIELDAENKKFTDVDGTVYDYKEATGIAPIKIGEKQVAVYYLYDGETPVTYEKSSLGDLTGSDNLITRMTDRLTANEVFGESEVAHNKFLKYVGDCTISSLADEVLNLTIDQVFHADIYQADAAVYINFGAAPMTDANGNSIPVDGYYTMDADGNAYAYTANDGDVLIYNGNISFLDDSAEAHKVCAGDFFKISGGDKLFYTPTAADVKPKWKYLLRTKTDGGEYTYEEALQYKASTDMDKLLDNMTENVHGATLQELSDDKILNLDSTMLESTVQSKIDSVTLTLPDGVTEGKKLGELTTEQMLAYTSALMAVIEDINNA